MHHLFHSRKKRKGFSPPKTRTRNRSNELVKHKTSRASRLPCEGLRMSKPTTHVADERKTPNAHLLIMSTILIISSLNPSKPDHGAAWPAGLPQAHPPIHRRDHRAFPRRIDSNDCGIDMHDHIHQSSDGSSQSSADVL